MSGTLPLNLELPSLDEIDAFLAILPQRLAAGLAAIEGQRGAGAPSGTPEALATFGPWSQPRGQPDTASPFASVLADLIGTEAPGGTPGDDRVLGTSGAERLGGDAGNDRIAPGAGDDVVLGGTGFDTVVLGVARRQAGVVEMPGGVRILESPEGRDMLAADVEAAAFVDGVLHFDAGSAAAQVHRIYLAALGREPDVLGMAGWVRALEGQTLTLRSIADAFIGAPEFRMRFGDDLGDADYVRLLYQNVLGREPEAAGAEFWTGMLGSGLARAEMLLAFSESAEFMSRTAADYASGIWVVNEHAFEVLRLYGAVLDRLPDAGGLAYWTHALEGGVAPRELAGLLMASPEFQARYGGLTDRAFVEQLYMNVLDRPGEAEGVGYWAGMLERDLMSRDDAVMAFAGSAEYQTKLLPFVTDGIVFA